MYASVLRNWFGVSQSELQTVLLRDFQSLPIIAPPHPDLGGKGPDAAAPSPKPAEIALQQNYPNPFNPTTRIAFSSAGGYVQIKFFDTLGREVQTLVDGEITAGAHEVVFEADRLPAGTYYYRMQSGSFQQVKSMQIIK